MAGFYHQLLRPRLHKIQSPTATGTTGFLAADPYVLDGYRYQGIAPAAQDRRACGPWRQRSTSALDWVIAHRTPDNIVAVEILGANYKLQAGELQTAGQPLVSLSAAPPATVGDRRRSAKASPESSSPARSIRATTSAASPSAAQDSICSPPARTSPSRGTRTASRSICTAMERAGPRRRSSHRPALIKQINPKLQRKRQILSILKASGTPVYDPVSGLTYPELNVNAALALAISRSQPAPPPVAVGNLRRSYTRLRAARRSLPVPPQR